MKRKGLSAGKLVLGIGLVVLALGGTATAAKVMVSGKQIKNNTVSGVDIKDKSLSAADFNGAVGGGGSGGQTASGNIAYARVDYPGAQFRLDQTRSKNITAGSEHPTVGGIVCLDVAVPFVNAVASADGGGIGTVAQVNYSPETGGPNNCPIGTDVSVETRRTDTSTFLLHGFSIVFN